MLAHSMEMAQRGWHGIAVVLISACASAPTDGSVERVAHAEVVEVIDGDTIRARISDTIETIRLVGIDTPETKHPTKGVQCFGPQATAFVTRLLPVGTMVRIERDAEARDSYGRLLLYVFRSNNGQEIFVNHEIVLRGFARPLNIEPNSRYHAQFVAAAFAAQHDARGLWARCK